jgi:hypothetical protein
VTLRTIARCVGLDIRVKKYVLGSGTTHLLAGKLKPVKLEARSKTASVGGGSLIRRFLCAVGTISSICN